MLISAILVQSIIPGFLNTVNSWYLKRLYLKVSSYISKYSMSAMVPENLLWDISSLRKKELKCKE